MKNKLSIIIIVAVLVSLFLTSCKQNTNDLNDSADNPIENVDENKSQDKDEPKGETDSVQEDVYQSDNLVEENNVDDIEPTETIITDKTLIIDIKNFMEIFYSNYEFKGDLDGIIKEADMQLFSIYYIVEYEYSDLKFDISTSILYIPKENVSTIIKKFFDVDFINHKQPESEFIEYKNDEYLVLDAEPAELVELRITKVTKKDDFTYNIEFEPILETPNQYQAVVEEREGRYILLSYKKVN